MPPIDLTLNVLESVAYQPLSRLNISLTTRLGRVKQVIISSRCLEGVNFKDNRL